MTSPEEPRLVRTMAIRIFINLFQMVTVHHGPGMNILASHTMVIPLRVNDHVRLETFFRRDLTDSAVMAMELDV
jgi:hypothetical protein